MRSITEKNKTCDSFFFFFMLWLEQLLLLLCASGPLLSTSGVRINVQGSPKKSEKLLRPCRELHYYCNLHVNIHKRCGVNPSVGCCAILSAGSKSRSRNGKLEKPKR